MPVFLKNCLFVKIGKQQQTLVKLLQWIVEKELQFELVLNSTKYLKNSQNENNFDSKIPTGGVEGFEINADFKVPFRN